MKEKKIILILASSAFILVCNTTHAASEQHALDSVENIVNYLDTIGYQFISGEIQQPEAHLNQSPAKTLYIATFKSRIIPTGYAPQYEIMCFSDAQDNPFQNCEAYFRSLKQTKPRPTIVLDRLGSSRLWHEQIRNLVKKNK